MKQGIRSNSLELCQHRNLFQCQFLFAPFFFRRAPKHMRRNGSLPEECNKVESTSNRGTAFNFGHNLDCT